MEQESADTIVGINAPVDLAGRTPLAWSVKAARNKRNKEVHLVLSCPALPCHPRLAAGATMLLCFRPAVVTGTAVL